MKNVYILWDTNNTEEIIGVFQDRYDAREAAVSFLISEAGYSQDEWEEFAHSSGYESVAEFQDAMKFCDDHDEFMFIRIEEWPVK